MTESAITVQEASPSKSSNSLAVSNNQPERKGSIRSMLDLVSLASSYLSNQEPQEVYRRFTESSWEKLLVKEQEDLKKKSEKKDKPSEGKLVDGEIKFDTDENEEENIERDPDLVEGNVLPESQLGDLPSELLGVPIEEIDKYIKEKTCVVINTRVKKKNIFRFSATKAFFLLPPWNPLRKLAILISTNQIFDYIMILTILTNCVFLTLDQEYEIAEYVFLSIYTVEMLVKMTSRGLFLDQYTYLRDLFNWLDIVVIITSYVMIVVEKVASGNSVNLSVLRVFRVFRILKTISIFPGLKTIVSALFNAFRMLLEVIALTLFCMSVFSLFALQIYMGVLRNKCVKNVDWSTADVDIDNASSVNTYYDEWIKNSSNWLQQDENNYWTCGNASGAGVCGNIEPNYTCLANIGDNPNWGYTNYDNFGWALLSLLQLITLDFWEDQYNLVNRASGPWNVLFFVSVVFFGSFYLINLMLAVVAMSYEEEAVVDGKLIYKTRAEKEREKREAAAKKQKKKKNYNIDPNALKKKKKKKKKRSDGRVIGSKSSIRSVSQASLRKKKKTKDTKDTKDGTMEKQSSTKEGDKKVKSGDTSKKTKQKSSPEKVEKAKSAGKEKGEENGKQKSPDKNSDTKPKKVLKRKDTSETLASQDSQSSPSDSGLGSQDNMDIDDDDDDERPQGPVNVYIDDEVLVDRNCPCCGKCCKIHWIPWLRFQNKLYEIVTDLFFDFFITFCIIANTAIMAAEHYPSSETLTNVLDYSNFVFTAIFGLECLLKILAMSKEYFYSGWNIFDLVVVIASFIDMAVTGIEGLSIFRAFRVFRIFKLAHSWVTMRLLLTIIFSALGAVGNLTLILVIVIFIFAVVGKVLFKGTYTTAIFGDDLPRWHFDDIGHAMLMIFRILCGEWIEPLWDCMRANGNLCMIVFIPTLVLGNLMVLNLFLALLINSFGSDSLKKETNDEESKLKQAVDRIRALIRWKNKVNDEHVVEEGKANEENSDGEKGGDTSLTTVVKLAIENEKKGEEADSAHGSDLGSSGSRPTSKSSPKKKTTKESPEKTKSNQSVKKSVVIDTQPQSGDAANQTPKKTLSRRQSEIQLEPPGKDANSDPDNEDQPLEVENCCCEICYCGCCSPGSTCGCCYCCMCDTETPAGHKWHMFRYQMLRITEHRIFEGFVLIIIIASSATLGFEDIYLDDNPQLKTALKYVNIVFAVLFTIEMIMKWIAQGFKKYFTNFWTNLDFVIVCISLVDILATAIDPNLDTLSAFRAVRTLRAFRPLRTVSRLQSMKIVVNALMHAIPAIFNVFLVCLVFWIIFSIFGVQTFKGKFFSCVDTNMERLDYSLVPNKTVCLSMGYIWQQSRVNFDNTANGFLALYQVATFEGWMEVMNDATDMTSEGQSPKRENSVWYYLFFVIFIIVGTFFALNLFIGVIIDNFNTLKKKYEGSYLDMFLTSSQKSYYNTMKKLGNKKPQKTIKRPKNKVQSFFFDVAISNKFELTIVILIFLNMTVMMVEHYQQPKTVTTALDIINIIFTTIFTLEAIIKIVGLRWHYFRRVWNVFDFIIVILSVIGIVLSDILSNFFVTPTLLRVVRIFRIGRVLRLIKAAKGIRKLLFALIISLPALLNIAALLILIVFIYAIIGMSLFGNIKHNGKINDLVNFETFGRSMVLLIRLTTSAGWNDILDPMMAEPPFCNNTHVTRNGVTKKVSGGDCGIPWFASIYMFSFTFVTYLIVINTYIAVILENFNQAHEQEEVGITEDDFDMFYVVWERYDPHASQYIKYEQLSDFVAELDEPIGIPKPNVIALVSFDLPIVEGDKLHCLDILIALVRHVLGDVEETAEFRELKTQMEQKYQEAFPTRICTTIISTTMRRKKEDIAAKLLQRAWRRHKAQRAFRQVTENAMMMAGKSISGAAGAAASQLAGSPGAQVFGSNASLRPKKGGGDKPKPPPGNTSLYKAS